MSDNEARKNKLAQLNSISRGGPKIHQAILHPLDDLSPGINKKQLAKQYITAIQQANIGDHWGHDSNVNIGPFTTTSQFNTIFNHELGHRLVEIADVRTVFRDYVEEEDFCHRFSKHTCQVLNIDYDDALETLCREFNSLGSKTSEEQIAFLNKHSHLPEARVLGFARL